MPSDSAPSSGMDFLSGYSFVHAQPEDELFPVLRMMLGDTVILETVWTEEYPISLPIKRMMVRLYEAGMAAGSLVERRLVVQRRDRIAKLAEALYHEALWD